MAFFLWWGMRVSSREKGRMWVVMKAGMLCMYSGGVWIWNFCVVSWWWIVMASCSG